MEFKEGTTVYSSDGQDVGRIDRVVIKPRTKEVTHLIIRQGFLFTEDKVLPVDLIAHSTENRVTLTTPADALDLANYEETYYLPTRDLDDVTMGGAPEAVMPASPAAGTYATGTGYAPALYPYPPLGVSWWGYRGYAGYPGNGLTTEVTETNIPNSTVALKEGAPVYSADDERVGTLERVYTDHSSHRATHLVISQGLIFTNRKLIPTSWVNQVSEDRVDLSLEARELNNLPDYETST